MDEQMTVETPLETKPETPEAAKMPLDGPPRREDQGIELDEPGYGFGV